MVRHDDISTPYRGNTWHEKIIIIGNINSADDRPNQIALKAFPLLSLKYLEIVVVEVCDIKP